MIIALYDTFANPNRVTLSDMFCIFNNNHHSDYPCGVLHDVRRRMRGEKSLAPLPDHCGPSGGQLLMLRMRVGDTDSELKSDESEREIDCYKF